MDLTCKSSTACYTKDQTLQGDFYVLSTILLSTPQDKDPYKGMRKVFINLNILFNLHIR